MSFDLIYPKSVAKQLAALPPEIAAALRADFERFAAIDPTPPDIDVKKIQGHLNTYRIRRGDYRLLFELDKQNRQLNALQASHRKDAY